MKEDTKLIYKNPKEFFRRWKNGIKNLTPAQQLHSKIIGLIGNMVGIVFAWVFLWLKGFWFFSISMAAVLFLLSIDLISTTQQYKASCIMMDELKMMENLGGQDDEKILEKES